MVSERHLAVQLGILVAILGIAGLISACGESATNAREASSDHAAPAITLEEAVLRGDDHAVRTHILAGTPINSANEMGDTPLHIAAALGRAYAVEVLVDAGADLESANSSGVTPLFNAAFFCHPDVLRTLIDAGARTDVADQTGTPLRQIMAMPWTQIRPVYEMVHNAIGLPFDEDRIEAARPKIAAML